MRGEADLVSGARARARAIVDALRAGEPNSGEVFEAFAELDTLPADAVREALDGWTGPPPDPERLDAATRRAHGMPPPALRLRSLAVVRDADVLDLGPIAEEQLRIGGLSWDAADLSPEDRLDGEVDGSFAGTLEHRVLVDAETSEPCFDALLYAGDAGVIFRAGTTTLVARIAESRVETTDRRIRVAVEAALADRSSRALPAARSSRALPAAKSTPDVAEAEPKATKTTTTTKKKTKAAESGRSTAATRQLSLSLDASPATKKKKSTRDTPKVATPAKKKKVAAKKTAAATPAKKKKAGGPAKSTKTTKVATAKKTSAKKTKSTAAKSTAPAKKATAKKTSKVTKKPAAKRKATKS